MAHGEKLFEAILEQEGARLPGARRFVNRERTPVEGFDIPKSLYDEVVEMTG